MHEGEKHEATGWRNQTPARVVESGMEGSSENDLYHKSSPISPKGFV